MRISFRYSRAALLAIGACAAPAAAQQASPADCHALALLRCSADMCAQQAVPGAQRTDEGNWLATEATDQRARISFDAATRRLSICWDGRCWNGIAARTWASGSVTGAAGTMTEQFLAGFPASATFQITYARGAHGMFFSLLVDPTDEQSDAWSVTGRCEGA